MLSHSDRHPFTGKSLSLTLLSLPPLSSHQFPCVSSLSSFRSIPFICSSMHTSHIHPSPLQSNPISLPNVFHSPHLIPNPSLPLSNTSPSRIIGNGLGALENLSPPTEGGRFGKGAEGGGAGGPNPTTGIPKSRAGREVRGFADLVL